MAEVLTLAETGTAAARALLARLGLELVVLPEGSTIPGSYWGECEAGLIGNRVHVRLDTPVHSLLHETCHVVCMPASRRVQLHTDASDSIDEEDATCYLQILLADAIPGFGRMRALSDMDAWGYNFRLGSARAWFERDAENAHA